MLCRFCIKTRRQRDEGVEYAAAAALEAVTMIGASKECQELHLTRDHNIGDAR